MHRLRGIRIGGVRIRDLVLAGVVGGIAGSAIGSVVAVLLAVAGVL